MGRTDTTGAQRNQTTRNSISRPIRRNSDQHRRRPRMRFCTTRRNRQLHLPARQSISRKTHQVPETNIVPPLPHKTKKHRRTHSSKLRPMGHLPTSTNTGLQTATANIPVPKRTTYPTIRPNMVGRMRHHIPRTEKSRIYLNS